MPAFLAMLAFVFLSSHAFAQLQTSVVRPELEEEAALRSAERMGVLIFRHDWAAARATDALSKVRGFKRRKGLVGWITEAHGDEIDVTFLGREKEESFVAYYRVRVNDKGRVVGKPVALKVPEPLTAFEAAAAQARSMAVASDFQPCSERYNSVVLPQGSDLDSWSVYLLPGTSKRNLIPIGGSYRVNVNLRTGVANVRPFTKSCIQLEKDPKAVGLMISHLLDPVPTEVHVFWSIWAEQPFYVATTPAGRFWVVNGDRIKLIEGSDAD